MIKKSHTLYISFLPLILIIGLILGAGYFLTEGEIKLPKLTRDVNEIKRIEGYPVSFETDQDIEKQRTVIHNQQELDEFLKYADPHGILYFGGNVDFDKELLIGISSKTRDFAEDTLRIKRVEMDKNDKTLTVEVYRTEPGDSCEGKLTPQKTVSVDFVTIKKSDWKIEFDTQKQVKECN